MSKRGDHRQRPIDCNGKVPSQSKKTITVVVRTAVFEKIVIDLTEKWSEPFRDHLATAFQPSSALYGLK